MTRTRNTRGRRFQEQRLMATAVAAGSAFGWTDADADGRQAFVAAQTRRLAMVGLAIALVVPAAIGFGTILAG